MRYIAICIRSWLEALSSWVGSRGRDEGRTLRIADRVERTARASAEEDMDGWISQK